MTKNIAEKLFGRVVQGCTGDHVPDPRKLREPFGGPLEAAYHSGAYHFCRGCGSLGEVNERTAQTLARDAGTYFDGPVPRGIYFESDGCALCADGEILGLTVKPLPPLPNA